MMIRQNGASVPNSPTGTLYPADRCTWMYTYDEGTTQYDITDAFFYPGNAGAVDLLSNVTLGVIGKSGRFVPITE